MRWSEQSLSKLALQPSHHSERESVLPTIMPTTQHHAAFLRPMTVSCGRLRLGREVGLCLLNTYYVPGLVLTFASVPF